MIFEMIKNLFNKNENTEKIEYLGVDKDGNPSNKKKNFSGINGDATPEALATVADAIKLVLANQTRYTLVNEISMLENNA